MGLTPANHIWKPSSARTLTIDCFVPVARGSTAAAPAPLNWPAKDPHDILDYQLGFSPAVIGNDGDSITAIDVSVTPDGPGDIVVNSATADGVSAVLWLAGGQAGVTYTVTVAVATQAGRVIQRSILIPVLPLSVDPVPADALQIASGVALTDQNGNPVLVTT